MFSCHSIEIQTKKEMNPASTAAEKKRAVTAVLGLFSVTKPFEPTCIENSDRILVKRDFLDISLHVLTNMIVSSKTVYVYCP